MGAIWFLPFPFLLFFIFWFRFKEGGGGVNQERKHSRQNRIKCYFRSSLSSSPPCQTRRHYFSNVARHRRLFLRCLLSAQWKSVRRFSHPQRNEWQVVGHLLVAEDQCQESHHHAWHQQGHYLTTSAEKSRGWSKKKGGESHWILLLLVPQSLRNISRFGFCIQLSPLLQALPPMFS